MKKAILASVLILLLAGSMLAGCGKKTPTETETTAVAPETTEPTKETEAAPVPEQLLAVEEKAIFGVMSELMKDGSADDHYSAETYASGGAEFSFITKKVCGDGLVKITGSVFYGPETDLFDLDETAYYTEEDWEKIAEDPDYVPEAVLPSYEEILMESLADGDRKEGSIAGVTVTEASKRSASETENRKYEEIRACGADGTDLLWITVNIEARDCADPDAAIADAETLVNNWLSSLSMGKAINE